MCVGVCVCRGVCVRKSEGKHSVQTYTTSKSYKIFCAETFCLFLIKSILYAIHDRESKMYAYIQKLCHRSQSIRDTFSFCHHSSALAHSGLWTRSVC